MKARTVSRLMMVATLLSAAAYCVFGYMASSKLTAVEQDWQSLDTVSAPRNATMIHVVDAMGYGGFIHDFKNAVIRGDQDYLEDAHFEMGETLGSLRHLSFYLTEHGELEAVDAVSRTVEEYIEKLEVVEDLVQRGASPEVIDAAVRVDDTAAILGLKILLGTSDAVKAENLRTRSEGLAMLRQAMGYDGVIHHFKNVVLRGDENARNRFVESLDRARVALKYFRTTSTTQTEIELFDTIEWILTEYEGNLKLLSEESFVSASVVERDAAVRVNDAPAFAALNALERIAASEIERKRDVVQKSIISLRKSSQTFFILALIFASLASYLVWYLMEKVVVRPAKRVAREIGKLASGDLKIEIEDLKSTSEIGQIATATYTFKRALVELRASREKLAESQKLARYQALHDGLTTLPNRRALEQKLTNVASAYNPDSATIALFIDLDRFKHINDTYGHPAGDFVLRHTAAMLKALTRKGDFIARVGGDEFVIICHAGTEKNEADALANHLARALSESVWDEGQEYLVSASIGMAILPAKQAADLISKADNAMYAAKSAGRGGVAIHSETVQ